MSQSPIRARSKEGFVEYDRADSSFRGRSRGGAPFMGEIYSGQDIEMDNAPQDRNDSLVNKNRGPWLHVGNYLGPGEPTVNWTKDAPARPELHMRTITLRRQAGDTLTGPNGRHTNVPRSNAQLQAGKESMTQARQNRLTVQRYRGQSFSQTTKLQGE